MGAEFRSRGVNLPVDGNGFMTPMMNMYDTIRANLHFNKFVVGELLFVEYKCPIEQETAGVWAPMDYFVHVLSGRKTWHTTEGTWIAEKGQTLFFKKGAAIVHQDFKDDFCVLVFFVSDNFIRDVVREIAGQLSGPHAGGALHKGALIVNGDVTLAAYFQSMLAYFTGTAKPAETLLTSPKQWNSSAVRVFIVVSVWSGCSATFRQHAIIHCRKANR